MNCLGLIHLSCSGQSLPDPNTVARKWTAAVEAGDGAKLRALLDRAGRERFTAQELDVRLELIQPELRQLNQSLSESGAQTIVQGEVALATAPQARVVYEGPSGFKMADTAFVPLPGTHPRETLEQLRWALERRSFFGILRLLTSGSQRVVQQDLSALIQALSRADALVLEETGDEASVQLPSGHEVRLKRENGLWRVDELR